jgi:5-oxoprolinase (ATP-hydrolysing)
MVRTGQMAGFDQDDRLRHGRHLDRRRALRRRSYERAFETLVAGVRMRVPMMQIHTVAAGGGSILHFDGARYRVGPESAGANPGPACYRRGGPLAVTDCNVMLGKMHPSSSPPSSGPTPTSRWMPTPVRRLRRAGGRDRRRHRRARARPEAVAEGFLRIAVENMANAIKQISVQRGHDVTATRWSASAAPAASTPAWWPTRWA